ncbi:MAG: cell wall hydrolase [Bacillota bacterium]|nr:cell wall hydrolase [Bacillota bacterium]
MADVRDRARMWYADSARCIGRRLSQLHPWQRGFAAVALSLLVLIVWQFGLAYRPEATAAAEALPFRWGSRGTGVALIQRNLKDGGFYGGPVHGVYTRQTHAAVQLYQRQSGLPATGIADQRLLSVLGIPEFAQQPVPADPGPGTGIAGGDTPPGPVIEPETPPPARAPTRGITRENDVRLLGNLIRAEAESEPYIGKVAVAAVTLNRVQNPRFPNTLAGVVYQPGAFEGVSNGRASRPARAVDLQAARDAINGWDPTSGALYFWNPSKRVNPWIWSRRITLRIGRHVFGF